MGSRIATRLHDAGNTLTVWNRTPAKAEPLAARGARVAQTPADAARGADVVLTMLANPDALRAVVEGPHGLAAGAPHVLIEMSTVGPATVTWLASVLPEETKLLDAPVLGSLNEVEAGTLHVFIGGPDALAAEWAPLLSSLGTTHHVGPLGAGASAKLVANLTLVGVLALLGETLALADGLGLARDAAFEVLATTALAAQAERRRPAIEHDDYPLRFALSLARKDAELVAEAAHSAGVDARLAEAARSWLADAQATGLGGRDYTALLAYILHRSKIEGSGHGRE